MTSIPQSKDIEWQIGLKSKTQPLIACKKHISLTKTNMDKRVGKYFESKWTSKADRNSYAHIY
jgi:hypothetical protein